MSTTTWPIAGPYDLAEVARMRSGFNEQRTFDGVLRFAFCLDGTLEDPVAVAVRQDGDMLRIDCTSRSGVDASRVARQVARIVSADHDGDAWARVCAGDPVLARLHAAAPGFRPWVFHSPYEAAVWCVLSARRARAQGITLWRRLCDAHGTTLEVDGATRAALPTPSQLREVESLPGLPADRIPRLHAIADAAAEGDLDVARLVALEPREAMLELQRLPGIGPFYSALIVVRACGHADVLSLDEPMTRGAVRDLYGLDTEPDDATLERIAEAWRPFRTWACVTLRAVSPRLVEA
ncbi:DNA-3-methyladenine glycosylase family protein [Microbacterium sp. B2969]|uniref:DNA-3-methyladenine glycosylase family protein n=1 Tax=Microbacterium alkaliflavum TaxID=3248839 RepID=A0ABW7Q7X9_9MICO